MAQVLQIETLELGSYGAEPGIYDAAVFDGPLPDLPPVADGGGVPSPGDGGGTPAPSPAREVVVDGDFVLPPGARVDKIRAAPGSEVFVIGNARAQTIVGGGGTDILAGGGGGDVLTGGAAPDVFAFRATDARGAARITDFGQGDLIAIDDQFFGLGSASIDLRPLTPDLAALAIRVGAIGLDPRSGTASIDRDLRAGPGAPEAVFIVEDGARIALADVLIF